MMQATPPPPVDPTPQSMAHSLGWIQSKLETVHEEQQIQRVDIKENAERINTVESDLRDHVTTEETTEKVKESFIKTHPKTTIGGGLAIGGVSITAIVGFIIWLISKIELSNIIP